MNRLRMILILLVAIVIPLISFSGCSGEDEKNHSEESHKADLYYCPMHPNVTSDKPGVCPICHMDLVKKADDATANSTEDLENMLMVSGRGLVMANVSVSEVKKENVQKTIHAFGYLDFAEPNRKLITARFNGRIEKLYVDAIGVNIQKGKPLFEIYSPDLVQAQNEYLIALKNSKNFSSSILNNESQFNNNQNDLLNSAKRKLQLMGVTENQISQLEKSGEVNLTITYYSPFSGTVIDKKVQEGMYVNEGAVIYDVADLSTLWNISEIYSDDLNMVKVGDNVSVTTSSYPGEEFKGKVTFVYPVVNSEARTIKIRSELQNPRGMLKPQMYTETNFSKSFGENLVVPENAVLFTGKRNLVWVKVDENVFEPRDVKTGTKSNGNYVVLSGLKEGELVASSGGYLLDSESQLQGGNTAGTHTQHGNPGEIDAPKINENPASQNENNEHQNHSTNSGNSENQKNVAANSDEIWNKVCPVLGGKISTKVKTVDYKGKKIGFCCPGCDKDFLDDPEKYMKNLSADGSKFVGNKE